MKRSLLDRARIKPDVEMLLICDERIGDHFKCSFNQLKEVMDYYNVSIKEYHRFDIRDANEEWSDEL